MSEAQVFGCPNCGASLEYDGGDDLTVRCPYCSSSVIVPDELRDKELTSEPSVFGLSPDQITRLRELGQLVRANQKIKAIKLFREIFGVGLKEAKDAVEKLSEGKSVQVANMTIKTDGSFQPALTALPADSLKPAQPRAGAARWGATALAVSLTGVVLPIVVAIVIMILVVGAIVIMTTQHSVTVSPKATTLDTPTPWSFAHVALTFGGEGIGPGLFTDGRHIALDSEGNIYVGEYSDGRIQVFDASGEFVSLWMADNDTPVTGMAADRQGTVYVVHGGEIFRYEGATGKFRDQLEYSEGWGFDDVAVTADGGLVAAWYKNRDDIMRFDAQGNAVLTIRAAISDQSGNSELDTRVAVDGLGNIYALGTFNDAVFKFTTDGRFVTRFGSDGDEPGQFRAPHAIAVDSQGRVYVSDFKGIQVFDADGRYLDLIEVDGPAFGMAFNDQNELFVVARHKVIKYVLQQPQPD